MKRTVTAAAVACIVALTLSSSGARADESDSIGAILKNVKLPEGFRISLFARAGSARSIAVDSSSGAVFVGSHDSNVYLMLDRDRDGVADVVRTLADHLEVPNGLALHDGWLYVGEQKRIVRWKLPPDVASARALEPLTTVREGLPADSTMHGRRYIAFGPDRKLYVGVGAPCNVCEPKGLEATILRMDPDGGRLETVATGVRNTVGFDWHPRTGEMFFTDNGSDGLGNDSPPDELNRLEAGGFYGFPIYGGGTDRTTEMRGRPVPEDAIPPVVAFQAHTANLGMIFYTGGMFPAAYRNNAFVAQHGSFDREPPVGYRIVLVRFDEDGNPAGEELFATGFRQPNAPTPGRPVDIAQLPDGSLLVSDDYGGAVYRITYER